MFMNQRKHMYLDRKRADYMAVCRHKCKCGHIVYIPAKCKFVYCDWCFRRVWKDEQTKFKYKLMEKIGKADNEQVQKPKSRSR